MVEGAFFPDHIEEQMKEKNKKKIDAFVSTPDGPKQVLINKTENKEQSADYLRVEGDPIKPEKVTVKYNNVEISQDAKSFFNKMPVTLKVKRLHPDARLPEKKSKCAAAFDLFALEDVLVQRGKVALVRTGISIEVPPGYKGEVYSRSGLSAKQGVFVVNQPGKIDSDYRGEVFVILGTCQFKDYMDGYMVKKYDRIAQLELQEVVSTEIKEVEKLSETERGIGGMGSTGQ